MEVIDKKLLTIMQSDFPVTNKPYQRIADMLGISEAEVIGRLRRLKEEGIIRRVGGVFDSRKLGYYSTLCALKVPEEELEETAAIVNKLPGVTHNYVRNHSYNMWFTLIAPSETDINNTIKDLKEKTRVKEIMNLPAVNFFKVRVKFDLFKEKK